eukprot:NODE_13395_length_1168_cov_5.111431.p2 GENE.NODE_13395_length_1168_cov_5.111431~~NODE_13395_length_1168_cov_5.111431.p2  ORF type:complete len:250 (-),score=63.18 NODE_13395_length_1168_cov_5.111431:157-906(-)
MHNGMGYTSNMYGVPQGMAPQAMGHQGMQHSMPQGMMQGMGPQGMGMGPQGGSPYPDAQNPGSVAMTINGLLGALSHEQIAVVISMLDPRVVAALRQCLDSMNGGWQANNRSQGGWDQGRSKGGGGKSKGGKGGKGGGGKAKRPQPVPLDLNFIPETMPATTSSTGEQVAFQAAMGTPWTMFGPEGTTFKWLMHPREALTNEERFQIKTLLTIYAEEHSLCLADNPDLKLALRRGNFWVSYAGGLSSAT